MALLGNYSVLSRDPGRSIGGGAIGLGNNRSDFNKASQARGAFVSDPWEPKSGLPDGYRPPYCWVLPIKPGAIAARNNTVGVGAFTAAITGGLNAVGPLTGSGTISNAQLSLIVSAIAALTGSGTISAAALKGLGNAISALSGSGTISAASLKALGNMISGLTGTGTPTAAIRATGTLAAEINVTGDLLSTSNVADAIWGALAEGTFTYAQCMQIIAAAAGSKSDNSGQTFRDLSDTKDRITGTVSGGDRTAVTYDLD